ncbi:MAG: nitrous oxide-stimulated promoter family protein [Phycisphaerae bacterium]|nr:nitrous oxide-stimulated promoter family protein [Phycisphaerae bacterium]
MLAEKNRELKIITRFIYVFCEKKPKSDKGCLCHDCQDLLNYATKRLSLCPYEPKPKCKDCNTHCYKSDYRVKIREIMKFSGIYHVKRGRLDWLFRYFLS